MPRGVPVNWTREQLERVETVAGSAAVNALSEEFGVTPNSIYSVKARVNDEGIDAILERQNDRYASYRRGGRAAETLAEQLGRVYLVAANQGGRGGTTTQFHVTIPYLVGKAWVEKWGRQIRFEPRDDGLLIKPVEQSLPSDLPDWLGSLAQEDDRA